MTNINTTPPPVDEQIKGTWRYIKTLQERSEAHPDDAVVTNQTIREWMQAEIDELRNVMSDKDMELANLQRRIRVTEMSLGSVTHLLEKANCEIVVLKLNNSELTDQRFALMEQIGSLNSENERLRAELGDLPQAQAEILSEIKRLRAELQVVTAERDVFKNAADRAISENGRLRADAERYRWLRSTTNWVTSKGERIDVRNNPELWDTSIDAALAALEVK